MERRVLCVRVRLTICVSKSRAGSLGARRASSSTEVRYLRRRRWDVMRYVSDRDDTARGTRGHLNLNSGVAKKICGRIKEPCGCEGFDETLVLVSLG